MSNLLAAASMQSKQTGAFAVFAIVGVIGFIVCLQRRQILGAVAIVAVLFWLGRGIGHGYDCPDTSTGECQAEQVTP